ncbi:MAG: SDR family NAD(P)-dependent oxidoreductase [Nakamurella sp.]
MKLLSRTRYPYRFDAGTAIVTGAAGGIGAEVARGLAARGSHLVLLDRDEDGLARLVAELRAARPHLRIDSVGIDLGDDAATQALGARLAAEHPETTLLVNNAGVAMGGTFADLTLEEFHWLLDINFRAVVTLTHHLLPVLVGHRGAHLVNVSSVFGIIAPAGQSAYSASKFAVRGFTECLRQELAPRGVGVTCVHPGGIATSVAKSARIPAALAGADIERRQAGIDKLLTIPASEAAAQIIAGIEQRKPRVLIGWSARIPDILARITPGHYDTLLARARRR